MPIRFSIEKKNTKNFARAGKITTPHGTIETPAFVAVGTKGTVKSVTPEQIKESGIEVVMGNTYHLYLEPGEKIIKKAGGLGNYMQWKGPTMTDSGGFQVFSLGTGMGEGHSKFISKKEFEEHEKGISVFDKDLATMHGKLAQVDEEGVTFTSHLDGSLHRFTPERSVEIQHALGADMFFAFDECTSPKASYQYQKEALKRTHEWAKRSLGAHRQNVEAGKRQGIFGVLQGGPYEDLRKESARVISEMDFDGFGIGGSFTKEDVSVALLAVASILPEEKPRHLLGIGEPVDFFEGVEGGCDLFDCVLPTRFGRTGTLFTKDGRIIILNAKYRDDLSPIEEGCGCYTCRNFTRSYIAHLFRATEILGATLATIHNLFFIAHLVGNIRQSILDDRFSEFKGEFIRRYGK